MSENKFEDIYDVVKLIPKGRVSAYGLIAEYLGSKGGARLVGWAMNACHSRADVPAHRVVNASGVLTGKNFFATPTIMQELLEDEGIVIKDDKVQDFKNVVWRPVEELL
ncbi:MAG: methylated-DNA-protein-cysteine methyltransferase-like protein [Spirosomataceae bacterium]|jgi:methylated-DNA-protein-cysteine methyltransferase-like protein